MEEEGTEILFRPGTETILTKHFSSQGKRGKNAQLNLLQYCTVEEAKEVKSNGEVPIDTTSKSDGVEVNLSSDPSTIPPSTEEERQESTNNRVFFRTSTRDQPSFPVVNRHDSLVENASMDDDDESESGDEVDSKVVNDNYHPALKTAVHSEGQEAVWYEDEYSTISSIYVKPEKYEPEVLPTRPQNSRKKMRVPFFKSRGKKSQKDPTPEDIEPTPRPVKIHIKTKKIAKSVLLLPPKEAQVETTKGKIGERKDSIKESSVTDDEICASITENSIQARRLLDTVLSGDDMNPEESEQVAKQAFSHATAARRLAHNRSKNYELESDHVYDDDGIEEAIELENIMSSLAEEGEQAVLQHIKQCNIDDDNEGIEAQEGTEYENAIDVTMIQTVESPKNKKKGKGKFPVSGYASRAVHYLESILPKNIGIEKGEDNEGNPDETSNAEDFWSDAGISTLGLKNDTLEYGLNADEDVVGGDNTLEGAGLVRNDMMSLSSLNEILDGSGTVSDQKNQQEDSGILDGARSQKESRGGPSPRAAVQEIGIPRKKKKNAGLPPTHPGNNRGGILGLLTPKIPSSNHSTKKEQSIDAEDNSSNKKWGSFFRTPRANDDVPSQLNLVMEEPKKSNPEVHRPEETNASASPNSGEDKENIRKPSETEKLVKIDSDSCFGLPEGNRYTPAAFVEEESKGKGAQETEVDLKPSSETHDQDKIFEGKTSTDNVISEEMVETRSTSSQGVEEAKKSGVDEEVRTDLMAPDDQKSEDKSNRDRYHIEPIGKTPRRMGLGMEENTDRKFEVEKTENNEEKLAQHATMTTEKEEQGNQIEKSVQIQNDLNEKVILKKLDTLGQTCDPDETKMHDADNCKEVVVERNDNVDMDHANLKHANHPTNTKNGGKKSVAKPNSKVSKPRVQEMSTAQSDGSKSKLFGRVVDKIGRNKKKPLVPIAIVEEKYVVGKDMKKISSGVHHIHQSTKKRSEKDVQLPTRVSKTAVGQKAKVLSEMKKKKAMGSSLNVIDDGTTEVQKAISNAYIRAVESNEQGDDVVPLNYLSQMLRKKLAEENVMDLGNDTATGEGEPHPQWSSEEKLEADSFVAVIKGKRPKEAPGVDLEAIAIRSHQNRDPCIGEETGKVLIDLAPTPRRLPPSLFSNNGEETENKILEPLRIEDEEDERQRRKLITERLFQAGSFSFQGETVTTNKENSGDVIKTAPTVESAESYGEDPSKASAPIKEKVEKKNRENGYSRTKINRGRRVLSISFLKGNKRK